MDWVGRTEATEKGPADLVTQADLASQQAVRRVLLGAFPDHGFLGEEQDGQPVALNAEYVWIVDPLDGTTNLVHGLPHFAVSVALARKGKVVLGVVFNPVADECFTAAVGKGAFLNGRPLRTSGVTHLSEALIAASLPPRAGPNDPDVRILLSAIQHSRAIRRMGCASLNLCYLAAGRFDAYWANALGSWDVAAGVLMVQEAGGVATSPDGGDIDLDRPKLAAAANATLHRQWLDLLARAENGLK